MFGIGYEVDFLNQGGALVHVYTDGSVLLNHGGVEMGQGLYTKMIQVIFYIILHRLKLVTIKLILLFYFNF